MPKKPEVKKLVPKAQSPKHNPVPVKPPEPSKAVVFQLYECVVKLQVAKQLLSQVGIFPGDKAENLARQMKELIQSVGVVETSYRQEWFQMKGEAGE